MILAADVFYDDKTSSGRVAGILFEDWLSQAPRDVRVFIQQKVQGYSSGAFYKRELPCLKALLHTLQACPPDLIIIDGYVDLSKTKPGLGRYLFNYLNGRIPVVGVAKTAFLGSDSIPVSRFGTKPLFVSAAGIESSEAAGLVSSMHGRYRIPTLLKTVDQISRGL